MKPIDSNTITSGKFRCLCLRAWINWHCENGQGISRQELQRYIWKLERAAHHFESESPPTPIPRRTEERE